MACDDEWLRTDTYDPDLGHALPDALTDVYGTPAIGGEVGYALDALDAIRPLRLPARAVDYPANDVGLGTLMCQVWGAWTRWCPDERMWYVWCRDGSGTWVADVGGGEVSERAKALIAALRIHMATDALEGGPDATELKDWAKGLDAYGSITKIRNLMSSFSDDVTMAVTGFDADPLSLNCHGRLYDLRTGEWRMTRPEDLCRLDTGVRPDSGGDDHDISDWADPGPWLDFVRDLTQGDGAKAGWLQVAMGLSLRGDNPEEKMFVLYGPTGRNGKGVLTTTVEHALGAYAGPLDASFVTLVGREGAHDTESAQPKMASVVDERLVTLSEPTKGSHVDVAAVKAYTGGDTLLVRALYSRPVRKVPRFTMWLSCNTLPRVTDTTLFTANRVRVMRCDNHHEADADPGLKRRLSRHDVLRYVLWWMIQGAVSYERHGLPEPACVADATAEWKQAQDPVGRFLSERTRCERGARTPRTAIYETYLSWCRKEDTKPFTAGAFYETLEEHRVRQKIVRGTRMLADIALNESQSA